MKPRLLFLALNLIVPCALMAATAGGDDSPMLPRRKVLFFSKSAGYEHVVIRDPDAVTSRPVNQSEGNAVPGLAFQVLRELGAKNNLEFVFSKDGSLFNPQYLAQFDAYFFFTTGDLTKAGVDGNPPMTAEGKAALLAAVEGGKGFIGTHSASDTFHSPGGAEDGPARFQNDGENADPYIKMLGGEFIRHGHTQEMSHLIIADAAFPGASGVPMDNRFKEEIYSLKNFADNLHVILVEDTSKLEAPEYDRPSYPSTWAHMYGRGRVFYTNLGHRDDVWTSALFQSILVGGLNWATGRVDADVTPNLKEATPGARTLPPYHPNKH